MATFTAKQFVNAELPTTTGTLYTVPANTTARLTEIILCNCAGTARTVTVYLVEVGDTADDGGGAGVNAIMKTFNVPEGLPVVLAFNTYLEAGDTIQGLASGADVTIIVSGIEEEEA